MDNVVTYQRLERDHVSTVLFNNRITTMRGLYDILGNSSFFAIDTEHVAMASEKDRFLHQVGLAHIHTLGHQDSPRTDTTLPSPRRPHLQDFYTEKEIGSLTLNITTSEDKKAESIRIGGFKGMPDRRPHCFGEEQQVDLENLEAVMVDFVQRSSSKANLVLIGFEMAAEWTYLFTHFPRAIPFFSAWVDLRDIAKDISSSGGVIPGLQSLLQLFGYHWKDIKSTQHRKENTNRGNADNAGADAVATCALADALLLPENQEKLRFRQECGQIARIFTKKKGWLAPDIRHPFIATVRAGGPLPSMLDSGMKLARRFFNFSPLSTGVMSTDVAYLTFRCEDQMNQFVTDLHGVALPTGEILSVQGNFQGHKAIEIENREREQKQKLREKNRLEKTEEEIEDLGNLFS